MWLLPLVLAWRGTHAWQDPGKAVYPVRASLAGTEGVLEAAVEPLHQPVPLWKVGSGLHMLVVQQLAESCPHSGSKLYSPVGSDGSRYSKMCNPPTEEGTCTIRCHRRGQQHCICPPRGAVNDGEEVCAAPTAGKGAHQIHVNVAESAAWNWDVEGLDVHVLGDLALLASKASMCPCSDVSCSSPPDKP